MTGKQYFLRAILLSGILQASFSIAMKANTTANHRSLIQSSTYNLKPAEGNSQLNSIQAKSGNGSFRQLQNIRQSTLPMMILVLVAAAFIVAFKVFLLLWKVTYYEVADPYVTSGPIPGNIERAIEEHSIYGLKNPMLKNHPDIQAWWVKMLKVGLDFVQDAV